MTTTPNAAAVNAESAAKLVNYNTCLNCGGQHPRDPYAQGCKSVEELSDVESIRWAMRSGVLQAERDQAIRALKVIAGNVVGHDMLKLSNAQYHARAILEEIGSFIAYAVPNVEAHYHALIKIRDTSSYPQDVRNIAEAALRGSALYATPQTQATHGEGEAKLGCPKCGYSMTPSFVSDHDIATPSPTAAPALGDQAIKRACAAYDPIAFPHGQDCASFAGMRAAIAAALSGVAMQGDDKVP